jgi:hypothetical protein
MAGKSSVDMRVFLGKVVEAHKKGMNQSWIANELGVTPAAVSLRISGLRKKGVKLPELVSGRGSVNTVEDANNILADLGFDSE